ncbi:hypothetical protein EJF18_20434 [Clavispora lusitaniae]|uniref:Uncharacterized protein n=1 Tax=Clavispora lusitaniae TaxID=36911 RepID=A0ACD0WGV5_CLALS|nr:hypothetical protein E0198_001666 [Clavispora lusitaniae]QFZ26529.1 hypothetical protein EJF14_20434 [Clavispora lusitaniae]QFZ32197.1 hypothetical protein EJF16_20434 [Clavispora lusitaniae]QFZ37866.1 hypothetical protein EJF15_20434 [Clavispora lusitaniae]QFZ43549.1 hypothetical protein EJF18_20434 [Clavispora lusitaniae]
MLRRSIQTWCFSHNSSLRRLSSSAAASNKLPSSILDVLKAAPPSKKQKKRILILSPEETKDRVISKFVERPSKSARKKLSPKIIRLDDTAEGKESEPTDITHAIDYFKPKEASLSAYKASALIDTLSNSFKKSQLVEYVKIHNLRASRSTKQQLAETILRKVWKAKIPEKFKKSKRQILLEESVPLNKFEMFLLLSQKGAILRSVRSAVSKFGFDKERAELVMTGTQDQLDNARILLQSRLEGYYKEELDLTAVKKLYLEKFGEFSFKEIGKNTEVYFNHLSGDKYELAALNPNQVKRIRRLLLWHLDYNLHNKNYLHLPGKDSLSCSALLPYSNDYSMSWKDRFKPHFVLRKDTSIDTSNTELKNELEKFSDESLAKFDNVLDDLDDSKESDILPDPSLNQKTIELLESLGLMKPEDNTESTIGIDKKPYRGIPLLSADQRKDIFNELTDFGYTKQLIGLESERLEPPVFTVTLGNVLFQTDSDQISSLLCPSTKDIRDYPYSFSTNAPLVFDEVLSRCEPYEGLSSLEEDPHVYSLQFKFTPSPFVEEFTDENLKRDLNEQVKYPPIELWMQLNDKSIPDIESLQAVTVESENNSYVCCPQANADMKVSCQVTGQILSDDVEQTAEAHDIGELLSSTTSKYNRLESQPGLREFLENSELDFSGRKSTSIAPFCDFIINGQKVRYNYVNVSYRRELTLKTSEDKLVQLSVVDGGSLGGRRLEARFIGLDGERSSFDKLLDYVERFVTAV